MKTDKIFFPLFLLLSLLLTSTNVHAEPKNQLDTKRIEELTGLKGTLNEKEGVFKVSYPRTDLSVTAAGVHLTPAMGLTAWAAFTPVNGKVMVMGDLVLLEDQVTPVMSAALDNGLEVTALHNHFFWETPRVMFMHISGMGSQEDLAKSVGNVFAKLKETEAAKEVVPNVSIDPKNTSLDPQALNKIFGATGELKDGVYKITFGKEAVMHGRTMGNAMGINTWAAFAGSNDQAVVDGDFAMLETELQNVLKSLRRSGINIVAIHNHMNGENPRIMFLHYWGTGPAKKLAEGVKDALDKTSHN